MSKKSARINGKWVNSAVQTPRRCARAKQARRNGCCIEPLEQRTMLSSALEMVPLDLKSPETNPSALFPVGYTPSQIQQAYGLNGILLPDGAAANGKGQTIAIVDAYDNPNIIADEAFFNSTFGLQQFNVRGGPTFRVLNELGIPGPLPTEDFAATGNYDWSHEESLDVEWAHVIAPMANIVLIETTTNSYPDLITGNLTAAALPGVSVVSNSWGSFDPITDSGEFVGETAYDADFVTPKGHQGVTFTFSTGDNGVEEYPSASPNVLAVGGTSLFTDFAGNYVEETAWTYDTTISLNGFYGVGGGGGVSPYEPQPFYQKGKVNGISNTQRVVPDVAWLADPNTGVAIYNSISGDDWVQYGGTSLANPMWAALISIVNQGRVSTGLGTLNGTQTNQMLYNLPSNAFHDITIGNDANYSAGPGYDAVTGLGSPICSVLIPDMLAHVVFFVQPQTETAGQPINPSVVIYVENGNNQILNTFNFSVTLSLVAGPGTLGGALTATSVGGIATFTNLVINQIGTGYQLGAGFTGGPVNATSDTFNVVASTASFDLANAAIIDAQDAAIVNPAPDVTIVYRSDAGDAQPAQPSAGNSNSSAIQQVLSDSIIISQTHRLENVFGLLISNVKNAFGNLQTTNIEPVKLAPDQPRFASGTNAAIPPAKGTMLLDDLLIAAVGTAAFKAVSGSPDQRKRKSE